MHRTRNRPLAGGRLRPRRGRRSSACAVTVLGPRSCCTWLSGPCAAAVAFVTWVSYLFVYTPLKTRTSLSTLVGAFPGALPPVIGWAAARGTVDRGAFVLFAILFLWQIPHFLAIAWIYREDYARGGLPMLPVLDPQGALTGRQAVANSLALLLVSLAPTAAGMTGTRLLRGRDAPRHRLHGRRASAGHPPHIPRRAALPRARSVPAASARCSSPLVSTRSTVPTRRPTEPRSEVVDPAGLNHASSSFDPRRRAFLSS